MFEEKKQDAFDALVGEWIGEVGQLHQQIQNLPVALDAALSPSKLMLKNAQDKLAQQLSTLPEAADKEMNRAGAEMLSSLSLEVSKIAQKIANDAATIERNKSFSLAVLSVIAVAAIFTWVGFSVRLVADSLFLNVLKIECVSMAAGIALGIGVILYIKRHYTPISAEDELKNRWREYIAVIVKNEINKS